MRLFYCLSLYLSCSLTTVQAQAVRSVYPTDPTATSAPGRANASGDGQATGKLNNVPPTGAASHIMYDGTQPIATLTPQPQVTGNGPERAATAMVQKAVETGLILAKPGMNRVTLARSSAGTLGQQVSAYMTYPELMLRGNHQGVVVITFGISDDSCLSRLRVHTNNQALNEDIIRQLAGRKIRLSDSNPMETYIVRLRFVL